MSSQDDLISQFKDVTGSSDDRARFYLESANWTLQLALSSFYENPEPELEPDQLGPSIVEVEEIEDFGPHRDDDNSRPSSATSQDKMSKTESFKKSGVKPKIATLHNMSQRSSDDEEEGQAFYAGGSERSGQQVLGPPKKKNTNFLAEMFKMAHESGAVVDPSSMQQSASSSSGGGVRDQYQGMGLRLGQTESDHTLVSSVSGGPNRSQNIGPVMLKLWSQGFSINDGELRPYDDPENKEFLETVMRGQVPNELRQMGNVVSVDLEDRRHEDYKKPQSKVKTFKGSGHTLGSPAPNIETQPTPPPPPPSSSTSNEENQKRATEQLNVNTSQPTTMLQIRLADGTRLSAQFNLSHTIEDICRYIVTARPQYESRTFILVTAFPTKELSDRSETIEKAGLANAALMQRLK